MLCTFVSINTWLSNQLALLSLSIAMKMAGMVSKKTYLKTQILRVKFNN